MGAERGLRRRLMVMAAGVVGAILIAEAVAWALFDRLDRSLERQRVGSIADVRRVLTLAESASSLTTFANGLTEIRDASELAVAEIALDGRLEDFAALAAALPAETERPAMPTLEPTIVRLADRLDGILRHLFAVTAEAVATRQDGGGATGALSGHVDPRQRYLLAAATVAATQMSGLVKDYASLVERSDLARAEATAADLRLGKIVAGIGGALALIVALGFANATLRGVVADLTGIAAAMRRLAGGDTSATAPGGTRTDEIGELARAFEVFKIQARERAEIESRLRHAERLEAIGRLTGGIAHDFNNLLTAVSTNVQLIHDEADLGSPTRARALRALAAAENGAAMVSHLLSFGRRQALAPVATDVDRLVASLLDLVGASLGGGIGLDVRRDDPDGGPHLALVDPGQLENALINLVFNARDAVGARGRITIVTGRAADGTIRLEVADDGAGMDAATLARVFEPFFTTKPSGRGNGLGLSMVYGFVRQSGGRIAIESQVGVGTTVTIHLPAAAEPAETPSPAGAATPSRRAATPALAILLVEDDAGVRAGMAEILADLGHRPVAVAESEAAWTRFAADPEAFDLVITDLALRDGRDGAALGTALRALRPDLPVLLVTGYASEMPPDLPVLAKPFRREDLAEAIDRVLVGRGGMPAA